MKLQRGGDIQVEETSLQHKPYNSNEQRHSQNVDMAWWKSIEKDNFQTFYKAIEGDIKHWCRGFAYRYRNSHYVDINDLISECNLLAWRMWKLEFVLDENYSMYINFKTKVQKGVFLKYLRTLQTNKHKMLCSTQGAKRIDQLEQEYGMELEDKKATQAIDNVLHKMHVEAIYSLLGKEVFTKHEEAILLNFKINPDVSIRGLAKILDLHPETMSRMLKKLRQQLKARGLDWDEIL